MYGLRLSNFPSPALRLPRGLLACIACVLTLGLSACGSLGSAPGDPSLSWPPEKLYAEAREELSSGRFDEALKQLALLESRFPYGAWAEQAQLDTAYAHYRGGDRTQALVAIERFLRLNPASSAVDYALYLKGLINFDDERGLISRLGRQDLSERDAAATRAAYEAFRELVDRFPKSKYAEEALFRMRYLVNTIAAGEVHIARFYFQRGAYVATVNRSKEVIRLYQDTPAVEEALSLLMRSYEQLGLEALRADTERVLRQTYPESRYLPVSNPGAEERRWWQLRRR